jgi:hypothetical protein
VSNLDESIGEILLNLQQEDPDTFKKIMRKAKEENPELFEGNANEGNKKINDV